MTSRTTVSICGPLLAVAGLGCSSNPGSAAGLDAGDRYDATSGGDAARLGDATSLEDATMGAGDATGPIDAATEAAPHVVTACPAIDAGSAEAGAWEDITPPQVSLDVDAATGAGRNYGTNSFVIDPNDTATVYLGTSAQGIYKTTDCGGTWTHIDTGRNGKVMDDGRQWAMLIDPTDPSVLYANSGYGPANGIFKSTNGGVDWDQILTPDVAKNFIYGGFVGGIRDGPDQPLPSHPLAPLQLLRRRRHVHRRLRSRE